MPGEGDLPLDTRVAKGIVGEVVDVRSSDPRAAMVNRRPVDVPVDLVSLDQFAAGLSHDDSARLVAGVAVQVGNIIVPDYVAGLEGHVALAAVGHTVTAGVQDAVGPVGPAPDAPFDDAGMDFPFRVSRPDGGKHLQIDFIQ